LLQGGVLLLLMARLISQVSFQPQLSIIAGTFAGEACGCVPLPARLEVRVTAAAARECLRIWGWGA